MARSSTFGSNCTSIVEVLSSSWTIHAQIFVWFCVCGDLFLGRQRVVRSMTVDLIWDLKLLRKRCSSNLVLRELW